MNADCSSGSNPLAQLSKKAQQNSLQNRTSPLSIHVHNAGTSIKTNAFSISDQNKQQLDQFMNIGGSSSDNRYMTPALSRSVSLPRSQRQTPLSPSATLDLMNTKATSSWSQEFYHPAGSPSLGSPTVSTTSIDSSSPAVGRTAYRPLGVMRPVLNIQRSYLTLHQQQQKYQHQDGGVMNNEQWDQRFQELELEVQKSLSISEQVNEEVEAEDIMVDDDYQAKFQQIWEGLQDSQGDLDTRAEVDQEWEADYQRFISGRTLERMGYKFEEENQYMHNPDAYEIGCILMENGAKLSEAALAFEAAVQQKPQHSDAWFRLGLVQTQNEKELSGISALEQCLKVEPKNFDAMMTLAIGYINEGYDVSAFTMLSRWLEGKYPTLVEKIAVDGIDRYNLNKQVIEQYLKVVNLLPDIDPDIQLGLGTLFYANDEFDKTIDCFRAAISVRPNDESMWNRLGASLANSNRSEEAIKAYHRAIQLKPTFVRARYNLAVSSMNIGCYKEAAENLLTALSMHEVEGVVNPNSVTSVPSSNILETLKRAFIAMDRRDLLEKVSSSMDLNQFRAEFTF